MRTSDRGVDPNLPGADLVAAGLRDLAAGRRTDEALLVRIGRPRLTMLGFDVPPWQDGDDRPEHDLYLSLRDQFGDAAHARYNALVRRLVSFEQAAARCGS